MNIKHSFLPIFLFLLLIMAPVQAFPRYIISGAIISFNTGSKFTITFNSSSEFVIEDDDLVIGDISIPLQDLAGWEYFGTDTMAGISQLTLQDPVDVNVKLEGSLLSLSPISATGQTAAIYTLEGLTILSPTPLPVNGLQIELPQPNKIYLLKIGTQTLKLKP